MIRLNASHNAPATPINTGLRADPRTSVHSRRRWFSKVNYHWILLLGLALSLAILGGTAQAHDPVTGEEVQCVAPPTGGAGGAALSDETPEFVSYKEFRKRTSAQELIASLKDIQKPTVREFLDQWSVPVQYTIVIVTTVVAVVSAWLLRFFYRLIRGIIQHRRACRIEATLMGELQEIDGVIMILAKHGCRFVPKSKSGRKVLARLLDSPGFVEFELFIEDFQFPVFVDGFHATFSPLYFLEPISRELHSELLQHSQIEPYLVPRIGRPSTRRKWRQQIKERTERLQEMRAGREMVLNDEARESVV